MNRLDSRFIAHNFTVKGKRATPPNSPTTGDQYIVAPNATGAFEGVEANSLALYNGDRWIFTTPEVGAVVYSLNREHFLEYDGYNWVSTNFNPKGTSTSVIEVRYLVDYIGMYQNPTKGVYCLNPSDAKIYHATAAGTFDSGTAAADGYYLDAYGQLYFVENGRVEDMGVRMDSSTTNYAPNGVYFVERGRLNEDDGGTRTITYPDSYTVYWIENAFSANGYHEVVFTQIFPAVDVPIEAVTQYLKEWVTETHTVTAEEATNQAFTLSNEVMDGEETNVICFVQGLAQPAGTAFCINTDYGVESNVEWSSQTLDGHISAGDEIIVQYIKANSSNS